MLYSAQARHSRILLQNEAQTQSMDRQRLQGRKLPANCKMVAQEKGEQADQRLGEKD